MKSELDPLMQPRSLNALLASGGAHENPCMYYLANGAKVGASTLAIKQRGRAPVLIVMGMERDEAAKYGLQIVDRAKYKPRKLLAAEASDALRAHAQLVQALCKDFSLAGSVGVYGRVEQGHTLALFAHLAQRAPAQTGFDASVIDGQSTVGGGSLPGETLPTKFVAVQHSGAEAQAAHLHTHGVIACVQGGQLLLDPCTVGDWPNLMRKSAGIVVNFWSSQ